MRFKVVGTKRDIMAAVIKNKDTIIIKRGGPVFYALNGTDDGYAAISANNLAAALQGNFLGVALEDMAVNALAPEVQCFGVNDNTRVRTATRAASTDVWASYAAGAIGDILSPVTGTGHAAGSTEADQAFSNGGSAAYSVFARVRLAQSYASATTQASSIGGSSTASVSLMKAKITAM